MKIRIPSKQVHQIGEELHFDIQFIEYPDLPTYGMQVPLPVTLPELLVAIKIKIAEVEQQMADDAVIRNHVSSYLDVDLDIEV